MNIRQLPMEQLGAAATVAHWMMAPVPNHRIKARVRPRRPRKTQQTTLRYVAGDQAADGCHDARGEQCAAQEWVSMRNLKILPSLNPHLEFLVAHSSASFYGDADFDVYAPNAF
jgi:hypothetical protein